MSVILELAPSLSLLVNKFTDSTITQIKEFSRMILRIFTLIDLAHQSPKTKARMKILAFVNCV
jgi:hypothetical protein